MNAGVAPDCPAPEVAAARAVRTRDPQGEPDWRILVVDSDAGVHAAMRAALQGRTLFGRALAPRHAFSGEEARALLMGEPNVAMVLLDVASEPVGGTGAAAGTALALVDFIRHTARLPNARIVLRTDQPGPVTDLDTLLQYDINDYRPKSELTHDRLLALVVTSVRSYQRLCAAEASRRSLELIVRSSASLLETTDPRAFASGVITQLAALLGVACHGLVCAQQGETADRFQVLAATGRFAGLADGPFDAVSARAEWSVLRCVLEGRCNGYAADGGVALYIGHQGRQGMAVFIDVPAARGALDTRCWTSSAPIWAPCCTTTACSRGCTNTPITTRWSACPTVRTSSRRWTNAPASARAATSWRCSTSTISAPPTTSWATASGTACWSGSPARCPRHCRRVCCWPAWGRTRSACWGRRRRCHCSGCWTAFASPWR